MAAVVAAALVGGAGCHLEADQAPVTAPQVEQQPAAFTPGTISRGGVTYMVDCEGEPRRSPTTIFVGCPDRYGVGLLRWRGWGTERAVGSGVAIVNRCVPSCSDPALSQYSVTVVLSDVKEGEASAFYKRMTIYGRDAPSAGRPAETVSFCGCRITRGRRRRRRFPEDAALMQRGDIADPGGVRLVVPLLAAVTAASGQAAPASPAAAVAEVVDPALVTSPVGQSVVWWGREADGRGAAWADDAGTPRRVSADGLAVDAVVGAGDGALWSEPGGLHLWAPGLDADQWLGAPLPGIVVAGRVRTGAGLVAVTQRGSSVHAAVRQQGGTWGPGGTLPAVPGEPVAVDLSSTGIGAVATSSAVRVGDVEGWRPSTRAPWRNSGAAQRQVAVDAAGTATVAWVTGDESRVLRAEGTAAGAFGRPVSVSRGIPGAPSSVVLAHTSDGGIALVWSDIAGIHRVVRPAGGAWGDPVRVAATGCAGARVITDVPDAGGGPLTVWQDGDGLWAGGPGTGWGGPARLGSGGGSTTWADAATGPDGVVTVAWTYGAHVGAAGEAVPRLSRVRVIPGVSTAEEKRGAITVRARRTAQGIVAAVRLRRAGVVVVTPGRDAARGRQAGPRPGRYVVRLRGAREPYVMVTDPRRPECPVAALVRGRRPAGPAAR